jgi:hypothetical protein
MSILRTILLLSAAMLLAAGDAAPSGEETAVLGMLNRLRTDYRHGEAVVLAAIRAGTVQTSETVWSKSAKLARTPPPPAVLHPALQTAAAAILASGAKLPDKALFDAGPALQQAAYPAAAGGGLVLLAVDAPDLATAFARAGTVVIKEIDKGKYKERELAAHEACDKVWREVGLAVRTGKVGVSLCIVLGKGSAPLLAGGIVYRDANRNDRYDPGEGVAGATASAGGLTMITAAGGVWWLAPAPATGLAVSVTVDGMTMTREVAAGATGAGFDWNAPAKAELAKIDQLIAAAAKVTAAADEAKRAGPQAALLIATRMTALDDARAATVAKLTEGVQFRFDNTREKVLEGLGESAAEANKLIAAQKKSWEGAMADWFKEAAALPRLREQVAALMKLEPVAAAKQAKPLLAQLDKAIAASIEPSFLDLYRTWQAQLAGLAEQASEPAKKK